MTEEPTPEQIEAAARVIDPNAFARLSAELGAAERESLDMTQATLQRLAREQARQHRATWDGSRWICRVCDIRFWQDDELVEHDRKFAPVQVDEVKLPAVTRVTLAGRTGVRSAEHWDYAGVELLVQDEGRTLKVLPLRGGGR
ncbi:hypothetical protein [Pseudomonas sp.]|uniref:hypothetical protein n=1 Tax=Pseudomonas sp. TaxID=306 RepID=UPI00263695AD|nr:hypothetical protein [Pseudomonas sp.]